MRQQYLTYVSLLTTPLLAGLLACSDPEIRADVPGSNAPAGVIEGSMVYSGPPPCTENGEIVGAALALVFDINLLPPPDGLGSSAVNLKVIPGNVLFQGIAPTLPQMADGSRWCPLPGAPNVTVASPFAISPMAPGRYQVRGFYDHDGDFHPGFKIRNLPTSGDVGGGAIANTTEVLMGGKPVYQTITLGAQDAAGNLTMPSSGARVQGVSVSLGRVVTMNRPYFHFSKASIGDEELDPNHVTMPSDFRLKVFSAESAKLALTQQSLLLLTVTSGLPENEQAMARQSPFLMKLGDPFWQFVQDTNKDGRICPRPPPIGTPSPPPGCEDLDLETAAGWDGIPETASVPPLDPQSVFVKLSDADPTLQARQSGPSVLIQNITLYQGTLLGTALNGPAIAEKQKAGQLSPTETVTYAIRPLALCLTNPGDPKALVVGVINSFNDQADPPNAIIADPAATEVSLSNALGGRPVKLVEACLPQGKYSLNVVNTATGQAWTNPNEAGVCGPEEAPSVVAGVPHCGTRPVLQSQFGYLEIVAPEDPTACDGDHAVPPECLPAQ